MNHVRIMALVISACCFLLGMHELCENYGSSYFSLSLLGMHELCENYGSSYFSLSLLGMHELCENYGSSYFSISMLLPAGYA